MPDPFRDLGAADDDTIRLVVDALERRGADPAMLPIIDAYIDRMRVPEAGTIVDIGAGTGVVTRRIAERFIDAAVIGVEPAPKLVLEARKRGKELSNLTFVEGDGVRLEQRDGLAAVTILHTVLSHVTDPGALLAEAVRITAPGGQVIVCDADFSKVTLAICEGDPLAACTTFFRENFVTDPFLTAKLRSLASYAGLETEWLDLQSCADFGSGSVLNWVVLSGKAMVSRGLIGQPLLDALIGEYERRSSNGIAYGFVPFITLIGRRAA